MNIGLLERNASEVYKTLFEDGDRLVTKTGCDIYIPKRFDEKKLAHVGEDTSICAIYAMVIDDKYYATCVACANMKITPDVTSIVKIDGVDYYKFTFLPGSVITPNLNLVTVSTLVYYIYDELLAKAKIPWYINYFDLGTLFDSAQYHADITLGADNVPLEINAGIIARDPNNITSHYRMVLESLNSVYEKPPTYSPISSVLAHASNVTARLMGNRFEEGLTSSLINPVESVDTIETILRL